MDPLEERRRKHFKRLEDICYLDHAGAGLYSDDQIEAVQRDLISNVYGNPHSANSVSKLCHDSVDQVRNRVLHHFNTTADEYSVIFTSGATAAMKMVAENFEWTDSQIDSSSSYFVYAQDNHTSVLGLAEVAKDKPVIVKNLSHGEMLEVLHFKEESEAGADLLPSIHTSMNSLFVYSAECNFSGVKYPLGWIEKTHKGFLNKLCGLEKYKRNVKWYCLLDAATFVSTNKLDLTKFKPDFVSISFYKIFGFPTGLGALLVRNSSSKVLRKRYFGGGAVKIALSDGSFHELRNALHERFEDGTINYLAILSLNHGFDTINKVGGGMKSISRTTFNLAQYTFIRLLKLHHRNGQPAVKLYIDTDYSSYHHQGAIVTFNMLRDTGEYIGFMEVLNLANLHNIQIRTGCFCNPGACQRHLKLTNEQLITNFEAGHVCGDSKDLLDGYPTGAVRVSFGYSSTQKDVDKLLDLLIYCFVTKPVVEKIPEDWGERLKNLNRCMKSNYISNTNLKTIFLEDRSHENAKTGSFLPRSDDAVDRAMWPFGSATGPKLHLTKIYVYPIKSCAYYEVDDSWIIEPTGLQFDREWMIVNERGVPLSQKYEPKICFIQPKIDLETRIMELHYKDLDEYCNVPLDLPNEDNYDESAEEIVSLCQSKVCGDNVTIRDCGEDVANWLAMVLERENVRLVRHVERHSKKNQEIQKLPLTLSNEGQYLLVNEASIKWLHQLVAESIDLTEEKLMHRFRCNFLMSPTAEPLEEFNWTQLQIGNLKFKVDGPCTRCQIICIDQQTGEKSKEPYTTLAANLKGNVQFGIYIRLVEDSTIEKAVIHSNDEITNIKL